jgi:hypothetical protein
MTRSILANNDSQLHTAFSELNYEYTVDKHHIRIRIIINDKLMGQVGWVFARSEAGIMVSNPTQGMGIWCVCVFLCLCTGRALATS